LVISVIEVIISLSSGVLGLVLQPLLYHIGGCLVNSRYLA
jgi:hypothetical protein